MCSLYIFLVALSSTVFTLSALVCLLIFTCSNDYGSLNKGQWNITWPREQPFLLKYHNVCCNVGNVFTCGYSLSLTALLNMHLQQKQA